MKLNEWIYIGALAVLAALLTFSCVQSRAADWSTGDTVRELAFEGLATADWAQTRWLATSPYGATVTTTSTIAGHTVTKTQQIELNPLIGPHPSLGRVNTYFAAALVLHPLVSVMLTHGVVRQTWQYGSIGVEAFCVGRNAALGIKMTF